MMSHGPPGDSVFPAVVVRGCKQHRGKHGWHEQQDRLPSSRHLALLPDARCERRSWGAMPCIGIPFGVGARDATEYQYQPILPIVHFPVWFLWATSFFFALCIPALPLGC